MSGRGRSFRPRIQWQICNRLGHLAQKCYYRFRRDFDGSQAEARATDAAHALGGSRSVPFAPQRGFDGGVGGPSAQRMRFTHSFGQNQNDFGQNQHTFNAFRPHYDFGQHWTPDGFYGGPMHNTYVGQNSALDGHVPRPGLSRSNLAYVPHEPSRPCAPFNGLRAGNAGGQLNEYRPVNNCVQVGYPLSSEPDIGDGCDHSAPPIPWRTKPRARVYSGSDPCIGLPRVGDLHASDFSGSSNSHGNTAQIGSHGGDTDGYIPVPVGSTSWYPDSGASNHVCRDASALQGSSPYFGKSSLLMGDGTPASISSVGTCILPTHSKLLRLSGVLCVPRILKNLMSVSQFARDNNVYFEFHPTFCVVKGIVTQETLLKGHIHDGLYQFSLPDVSRPTVSVPVAASIEVQNKPDKDDVFALWHKRLGHPSTCVIKSVLNKCNVVLAKDCLDGVCTACQKGKSQKLPFTRSMTEYHTSFELVVSDLWGPASVSCGNHWYYIAFVDVSTRFTWVYLLRQKSQALQCFVQFHQLVKTQFGVSIKQFQSDWGGEYRAFTSFLASQGIHHRITCPHTSEQNGVVERKHRHIVDMGITLLAQASLSMEYWGYAFCCAVHLINRLPTVVLKGLTPFQALYGHAPTYDHLRVFGCCCFPYLRPFSSPKLDFRSQPSIFLGYSPHHKGYQCLLPSGKIVVSRHVVFDETRFLSSTSASNSVPVQRSSVSTFVPLVRPPSSQSVTVTRSGVPFPAQSSSPGRCSSVPVPAQSGVGSDREPSGCSSGNGILFGSTAVEGDAAGHFVGATPVSNTHPMVTRAKAGIFKPKVMHVEVTEPSTIEEALSTPEWRSAVQDEYDALVRNYTWELVPLPPNRKVIGCK
ncbi:hypothetical protein PVK06_024630 [Gossypium arboreum]|uniref:Integrase catalytic domain-containing protein n=1 Tax=Gossypium arboreum TaxID=29729 RepID=A0ABR0PEV4_GOSAR|nr:hypothetical protein PVK06_024630 [Gossypium arboreum]